MTAVTDAHLRQFAEDGYFVLESAIPPELLSLLGVELRTSIDALNAQMDARGSDVDGLNQRDRRYFIANLHLTQPRVREFLFSEVMADVCRATLGPDVWHFFNQYVVKFAEVGSTFNWHQDSGYVAKRTTRPHRPYLSCWCPLDDVSEHNGTISLLPLSRTPTTGVVDHDVDVANNDLVGYAGDDPGELVAVPAGSIVVFSSVVLHSSGPNRSDRPRRVFLAQYSSEPLLDDDGNPLQSVDPFLVNGRVVEPSLRS
jgi:ectoine hydroxylase-related dioxygenase (phytanoyl-CoA dioxygenase family)